MSPKARKRLLLLGGGALLLCCGGPIGALRILAALDHHEHALTQIGGGVPPALVEVGSSDGFDRGYTVTLSNVAEQPITPCVLTLSGRFVVDVATATTDRTRPGPSSLSPGESVTLYFTLDRPGLAVDKEGNRYGSMDPPPDRIRLTCGAGEFEWRVDPRPR